MAILGMLTLSAQDMYENEVMNAIMARRSVRQYLDKPVERDLVPVLNVFLRVVENQQLIADVTKVYVQENPEQVKRDANFKNMFRNAPNLICVCTPAMGGGEVDAGLLGENMMLAAQSLGLGTCCLAGPVRFLLANENCKFFLDSLDIPEDYKLNFIIAIGYPDEQPEAKPRDESKVKFIK